MMTYHAHQPCGPRASEAIGEIPWLTLIPAQRGSGFRRVLQAAADDPSAASVRRPAISRMTHFVPAAFDLYEFDDRHYARSSGRTARRWFSGFNGAIGEPAQNVTLAWSDDNCTVLVRTDGHLPWNTTDARARAAHVALGGTALLPQRQPFSPVITNAEINRIVTAEELWHRISGLLGEEADAQAITWDEFALGYLESEGTAVFIAATNLDPHEFKIRKVRDWSEYDVVGSASFPLSALRGSP